MSRWRLRSRPPGGDAQLRLVHDADLIGAHLEDAAHFPGGHADSIAFPRSEADVAEVLRRSTSVLPIGAQSSLTGGATPAGGTLVSTARLNRMHPAGAESVRVQAGVTLADLEDTLRMSGRSYPPTPTFMGAFVGGAVATNAAGAATFRYGSTRDWVQALTVVLAGGDVLDIERGATFAHPDGYFDLDLSSGAVRVPLPRYRMPDVAKLSAGYFAVTGMDLIDLFIGSEGTLGVITDVTLRVQPSRPAACLALIPFDIRSRAVDFARRLRQAAYDAWRSGGRDGLDVSAIEHMDTRSLSLIREDGAAVANGVRIPDATGMALLVTVELQSGATASQVFDDIGRALDPDPPDVPIVRFCRWLAEARVLDEVEFAAPGDAARARQLLAVREAVPAGVNVRVGKAHRIDPRVTKVGADIIVPTDRIEEIHDACDAEFRRRGLDAAIWGHLSDGNLHANVIPRSGADVESGAEAMLRLGREAVRLGGAPLAEHGVGRNAVKQQLLAELYGADGIEEMRRVKMALDPEWKLSPGVLFPR